MDADDILEAVRAEHDTALSRLGSSKTLFADTGGDLEPETVLAAAATNASHAADAFESWTADADAFAGVFGDATETTAAHAEEIAGRVGEFEPGPEPALVEYLADLEDDLERAGGLLGWLLIQDRKTTQLTGYFTGQADPQRASVFRGYREEYDDLREALVGVLAERRGEAADGAEDAPDRVRAAAAQAVEVAYDEYVRTLESMGVNPKPVC